LGQQSKTRKAGRPKLPKGEAKGKIAPVRFAIDDLSKGYCSTSQSQQAKRFRVDRNLGTDGMFTGFRTGGNSGTDRTFPVTSLNHTPKRTAAQHTLHSSVRH
jgi:hypothetical protein